MDRIGVALIAVVFLQLLVGYTVYAVVASAYGIHIGFFGFTPAGLAKTITAIKAAASHIPAAAGLGLLFAAAVADLLPFILCARGVDVQPRHFFNRPKLSVGMIVVYGVTGLGVSMLASIFIKIVAGLLRLFRIGMLTPKFTIHWNSPVAAVSMILAAVIVAPFAEEFVIRGVLLTVFRRFGNLFAIVASSLVWALLHGNFMQGVPVFFMGLFFGFIAVKSESILPTIALHVLNNLLSVMGSSLVYLKSPIIIAFFALINISVIIAAIPLFVVCFKSFLNLGGGDNRRGFKTFFTSVPMVLAVLLFLFLYVRSVRIL